MVVLRDSLFLKLVALKPATDVNLKRIEATNAIF